MHQELEALFHSTFGDVPSTVASAPGRVNIIGEHLDYNGGEVLPIAIERRTTVAARRAVRGTSVVSTLNGRRIDIDVASATPRGDWSDYATGVIRRLTGAGIGVPPLHLAIASDVPTGSGLSSSAALEVAIACAAARVAGANINDTELARTGWKAESDFVGVPSGLMDQFASALGREGRAVHIWCDTERVEHVDFPDSVLIFDTATPRSLRRSDFALRKQECGEALDLLRRIDPSLPTLAAADPQFVIDARLPEPLNRRALHVSEENRRVQATVAALARGAQVPGDLLLASHASLRDLYECSSPELDWFVENAMTIEGIRGARLTGAGWGGCAIAIGAEGSLAEAAAKLPALYQERFGRAPRVWITRAADGVRIEREAAPRTA